VIPVRNENTGAGTGLCLEVHDLAVSKLVAGREKDLEFVAGLIRHRMAEIGTIRDRLAITNLAADRRTLCEARLSGLSRGG